MYNIYYVVIYINNKEYAASGFIKYDVKIPNYVHDYSCVPNKINRISSNWTAGNVDEFTQIEIACTRWKLCISEPTAAC